MRKLPPATTRCFEPDGSFEDICYWSPKHERDPATANLSREEWRDRVLDALRTAVRRRMVSDVPVGVLLSGGVDSSIITGLLAEEGQKDLMTFSIGFEEANGEKGDEFSYSDLIAERFGDGSSQDLRAIVGADERAAGHDQPRCRSRWCPMTISVSSCFRGRSPKHIKVVQSRPGSGRDFRRLSLVSAAAKLQRCRR